MGLDINVFRADFAALNRLVGCRDERLLNHLVAFYNGTTSMNPPEEDVEEEDEPVLSVPEALRNVLLGTIADDTPEPAYSEAVAMIYPAVAAAHIGDLRVAAWGIEAFFRDADAALTRRGFPAYFSDLVFCGCPMNVPVDAEPALGFIDPDHCLLFSQQYGEHDWSTEDPSLLPTLTDLRKWCAEAARHGHGLVSVGS